MQQITRRQFLAFISTATGASVLAACGGQPATPPAPTAAPEAPAAPTEAPAAPTAVVATPVPAPAAGTVTGKTVWRVWGTEAEFERFKMLGDEFKKQFPDIEIDLAQIPTAQYDEKILSEFAGGSPPNSMHTGNALMYQLALRGQLRPMDDLLASDSAIKLDDFYPALNAPASIKGQVYGLPVDCNPMVCYYNADMFTSRGMKTPMEEYEAGTWTWERFQAVAADLSSDDVKGFQIDTWWGPTFSWIWQNAGEPFDDTNQACTLDSAACKEAIAFMRTLVLDDKSVIYNPSGTTGALGSDALFQSGKLAMASFGRWMVPSFKTITDFKWDIAPLPKGKQMAAAVPAAWQTMASATAPENIAATWEWVKFFCGKEGQTFRLSGDGNAVPSFKGLEDIIKPSEGIPPQNYRLFTAPLAEGYGRWQPFVTQLDTEILVQTTGMFDLILNGDSSVDDATAEFTPKINEIITATRKEFGL